MIKILIKSIISLLFLGMLFVYINYFSSYVFPWQEEEAIETTLVWGGLAKLPKDLEHLKIRKEGGLFTRTFTLEFETSEKQIEDWIIRSKRLKNNIPEIIRETKTYAIHPGEKECYGGKVTIKHTKVTIKMSWS